ncbi:hypothetical protein M0R19_05610 [Candidatus Pacearchaeota archaeon]|nr:hypothetical protein [Candidatus Pacearchaeota archaeon]
MKKKELLSYCEEINSKYFHLPKSELPSIQIGDFKTSEFVAFFVFDDNEILISRKLFAEDDEIIKKELRHEMIHWYQSKSGELTDDVHNKMFWDWSRKLGCFSVIQKDFYDKNPDSNVLRDDIVFKVVE